MCGNNAAKRASLLVVVGVAQMAFGQCDGRRVVVLERLLHGALGVVHGAEACATKNDDGVLNTLLVLRQFGLEHFQLHADAPRFSAQQEFGVGKGQSVGVGLQWGAGVGMGFEVAPCVCQGARGGWG